MATLFTSNSVTIVFSDFADNISEEEIVRGLNTDEFCLEHLTRDTGYVVRRAQTNDWEAPLCEFEIFPDTLVSYPRYRLTN